MAMSDTIYYCLLADESLSTPFISALTVRPIDQTQVDEWYPSWNGPGWELDLTWVHIQDEEEIELWWKPDSQVYQLSALSLILITLYYFKVCRCCLMWLTFLDWT